MQQVITDKKLIELLLKYEADEGADISESVSKYRKLTQAAIGQWVKDFQEGNIQIRTVDDLEKLIRLDIFLQQTK